MPADSGFAFSIKVANRLLEEHHKEGKHYVEMPLSEPTSYKVSVAREMERPEDDEYEEWPVTPYQVLCTNNTEQPCFADLLVDGQEIDCHFLGANGGTHTFEGIPAGGGGIRELLFALPRFPTREEKKRMQGRSMQQGQLEDVGTIQVKFRPAAYLRTGPSRGGGGHSSGTLYNQANKLDVGAEHASSGRNLSNATTRMGKTVKFNKPSKGGGTRTYYSYVGDPTTLRVLYRTTVWLKMENIIGKSIEEIEDDARRKKLNLERRKRGHPVEAVDLTGLDDVKPDPVPQQKRAKPDPDPQPESDGEELLDLCI